MPVRASCSNGHTLNLDDKFAGKKVRCPKCGAVIVVPGKAAPKPAPARIPPPQEDYEDDDREDRDDGAREEPLTQEERTAQRREIKRYEANKILMGTAFFVSKVDHLVAMPFMIGLFAFAFWLLGNADTVLSKQINSITYIYLASMALQGLIGAFFWFFAPKKAGARGVAIAAASCEGVALLSLLLMAFVTSDISTMEEIGKARERGQSVSLAPFMGLDLTQLQNLEGVLRTFIGITFLLAQVFFLVALRGLANFYGDALVGARSMQILVWILADLSLLKGLGGVILGALFVWVFSPTMDPILFIPMLIVAFAGAIGVLTIHLLIYIKLVLLLYNVKKLVAKKL